MRILITGGGGFVAPHLGAAFRAALGDGCELIYADRSGGETARGGRIRLDVTDAAAVDAAFDALRPDHVVHLAGVSSVGGAAADPDMARRVNVDGALNVAEAMLRAAPSGTYVFAGSGQIYGRSALHGRALSEDDAVQPQGDYAVTKAAADAALEKVAARGLRVVRFRPFNHTGPGQKEEFVLPSFAAQIARIEAGRQPPVIRVGNLDAERDFLDVRDVAEAYAAAVLKGDAVPAGVALNLASGVALRIGDLLDRLVAKSAAAIRIEPDPARMRPAEIARFYGDASRAAALLGWRPRRDFDATLDALLAEARANA